MVALGLAISVCDLPQSAGSRLHHLDCSVETSLPNRCLCLSHLSTKSPRSSNGCTIFLSTIRFLNTLSAGREEKMSHPCALSATLSFFLMFPQSSLRHFLSASSTDCKCSSSMDLLVANSFCFPKPEIVLICPSFMKKNILNAGYKMHVWRYIFGRLENVVALPNGPR